MSAEMNGGRTVRLGAGMAFWGDRVQPAIEMVERGELLVGAGRAPQDQRDADDDECQAEALGYLSSCHRWQL